MLLRSPLAVLILFFLVSGSSSIQASPEIDFVVGVWSGQPWGLVEVRQEGATFELIQLSKRAIRPGELLAEFTFDKRSGNYIGRHRWISGPDSSRWGREGGVKIELIDDDHFSMFYLDSIYTGGWTFSKIVPSSGQMPSCDKTYLSCEYAKVLNHEEAQRIARLTPSALAQEDALYFVDVEKIREIAIEAVYKKYPDIPLDSLDSSGGIQMSCHSTRLMELLSLAGGSVEENPLCTAKITIKSMLTEEKYINDEGECRIAESYESISVEVFPDRGTRAGIRGGISKGGYPVECTEEFDSLSK